MGTRYLHMRPSSRKYRHFWINSLGSQGKYGTHAVPLSPIVSNIHAHSMPVSLTPTSTQLPSHSHSYHHMHEPSRKLRHAVMSSYTRFAFLFFLCVRLSTTLLARVPSRHTNTITPAEDSSLPLSLNTPFTLITQCLTVLLMADLCCY